MRGHRVLAQQGCAVHPVDDRMCTFQLYSGVTISYALFRSAKARPCRRRTESFRHKPIFARLKAIR